ncbi:ejaculatory bulb-specific protein 1 [Drosophila sechellia]|uniref:ejaculatory bulb-specific protein 1 n=1 Tax=Drosophila sechellia TaxID=7238 RepID=UPI0013DE6453|nr:ejaculatory bulb-specific protein 1 [Drosophila sechellia]
MVRQLILVLSLILFCGSSHAVISELARQSESVIQGLADIKMAPLRYLDVLFGGNPGGLRGLDGGNYASLSTAATLQAAKVANILARANILAGGDVSSSGYSKISAGVGKGSDLITIIKNTRSYDPYLIPPGIPGYNYPLGWPLPYPLGPYGPNRPPWPPINSPPIRPGGLFPGGPSPGGPFPGGPFPGGPSPGEPSPGGPSPGGPFPGGPSPIGPFPGGPSPSGPSPGGPSPGGPSPDAPFHGGSPPSPGGPLGPWLFPWIHLPRLNLPGRPIPGQDGSEGPSSVLNVAGGILGNGGLFGTGIFGEHGLFGTGFLSGPSLDPFGIFTPIGNFFGSLGNLFGFSSPSQVIPIFGGKFGRGLQGSITLDVGGTVPSAKGILGQLLHPFLGFLG